MNTVRLNNETKKDILEKLLKRSTNDYGEAEGYGTEGTQSYIPPYSTLIYRLHLCGISE